MKRPAQGVVEYLFISALILIIIAWAVHSLKGISSSTSKLGDSVSNAGVRLNKKAISEMISDINSS